MTAPRCLDFDGGLDPGEEKPPRPWPLTSPPGQLGRDHEDWGGFGEPDGPALERAPEGGDPP